MNDKITSIKVNLITLIKKIEMLECYEEINYELFNKLDQINKKLAEVETLIEEIEAVVEL
jgi:hypothetical protein